MGYVLGDPYEPYCVHSLPGQRQPASMCRICKDGDDLLAWKAYWKAHGGPVYVQPQREAQ